MAFFRTFRCIWTQSHENLFWIYIERGYDSLIKLQTVANQIIFDLIWLQANKRENWIKMNIHKFHSSATFDRVTKNFGSPKNNSIAAKYLIYWFVETFLSILLLYQDKYKLLSIIVYENNLCVSNILNTIAMKKKKKKIWVKNGKSLLSHDWVSHAMRCSLNMFHLRLI